jgi:hypothetical protein
MGSIDLQYGNQDQSTQAEILLALWLFVMGVNAQRWKEQATRDGATCLLN